MPRRTGCSACHRGAVDYSALALDGAVTGDVWDGLVRDRLVERWTAEYIAVSPWAPEIVEVELGTLVYLFDAAPTLRGAAARGDDRVVVVWAARQRRRRAASVVGSQGSSPARFLVRPRA